MTHELPSISREQGWSHQKLYEIRQRPDGRFSVPLISLIGIGFESFDPIGEGTFETREEAEAAVQENQRSVKEARDLKALSGSFTKELFIRPVEEGGYIVGGPGLVDEKGNIFGTGTFFVETWDEAKALYLKNRETMELATKGGLITIDTGKERIAFSPTDTWNPETIPGEAVIPLPEFLARQVKMSDGRLGAFGTYKKLVEQENWSVEVVRFILDVLRKEGKSIQEDLRIRDIRVLTPRQAMELSTKLVLLFTKYKMSDIEGEGPSVSDETDALTLLREGREHRTEEAWEGNGVCRNFAVMTKVIFDALKAQQNPEFSLLTNIYALYEQDLMAYDPRRSRKDQVERQRMMGKEEIKGHAWDSFVAVRKTGTEATITDSTWGKYDLDTKEISGLDHTLTRMEPTVYEAALRLDWRKPSASREGILRYYAAKLDYTGGVDAVLEGKRQPRTKEELIAKGHEIAGEHRVYVSDEKAEAMGRALFREIDAWAQQEQDKKQEARAKDERLYFAGRLWHLLQIGRVEEVSREVLTHLVELWAEIPPQEVDAGACERAWILLKNQQDARMEDVVASLLKKLAYGPIGFRFLGKIQDQDLLRFASRLFPLDVKAARRPGSELDKALTAAGITS